MDSHLRPKTDKDFGKPPPGYVAGKGRGASGFASGVSRDRPTRLDEDKDADLGDANYDKFTGYKGSLAQKASYDQEDAEADDIYDMIEARMQSRKKKVRSNMEVDELAGSSLVVGKGESKFSDYKSKLAGLTEDDWLSIPDAQERLKAKKMKKDSELAAPESLITSSLERSGETSLHEIGEAKKAVLEVALGREESSPDASLNPSEYLSQLGQSTNNIGDIAETKKARLLFRSITRSDPGNGTGWLASARLEEVSGNIPEAKGILARGITNCPHSEELWLNAIRLETDVVKAKSIVANAIRQNLKSVNLWGKAAELESELENKKKVFIKALEHVPYSIELWKELVGIVASVDVEQARLLLQKATTKCPSEEQLWLAYAKLSDFTSAQKILNEARRHIPTSANIWVAAIELAESMGTKDLQIEVIFHKGVESLSKNGVVLDKRGWLDIAVKSEERKNVIVPKVIVKTVVKQFVETSLPYKIPKIIKHEIFADFEIFAKSIIVSEYILRTAVEHTVLRERKGIWIKLVGVLTERGVERDVVVETFESAVSACPQSELLWLMYGKYAFSGVHDCALAKSVLERAQAQVPDSEDVYLAAAKVFERDGSGIEVRRELLNQGREMCPDSARLWMKSAQLERGVGNFKGAMGIIEAAVALLPLRGNDHVMYKFYVIAVQMGLCKNDFVMASNWANKGCEKCPSKPAVWIAASEVAIAEKDFSLARSILERGRIRMPHEESLWWKGYLVEEMAAGTETVMNSQNLKMFLSRALQACPNSGLLWSVAIDREPVATRHPKCLDGLKRCENDPLVLDAVARFFWIEKLQIDKARKWFQNCVQFGKEFGQIWADYFAFELSQPDNRFRVEQVLEQLKSVDPNTINKGIEWNQYRKDPERWGLGIDDLVIGFAKIRFPKVFPGLDR